jgi:uncharacterized membrane protein
MALAQAWFLRPDLGGVEGARTVGAVTKMLAAAALLGGVAYAVWWALDEALGRALWAQVMAVGVSIAAGTAAYVAAVWALRVEEADQIRRLLAGRLGRRSTEPRGS